MIFIAIQTTAGRLIRYLRETLVTSLRSRLDMSVRRSRAPATAGDIRYAMLMVPSEFIRMCSEAACLASDQTQTDKEPPPFHSELAAARCGFGMGVFEA